MSSFLNSEEKMQQSKTMCNLTPPELWNINEEHYITGLTLFPRTPMQEAIQKRFLALNLHFYVLTT